jgi:hypothetical protein
MRDTVADSLNLANDLRGANERLRLWLEGYSNTPTAPVTPEQIANLLSELLRAGEWLRNRLPAESQRSEQLQLEVESYRENVERLQELMPEIHRRLVAERARLEAERARVQAAANWAQASRQTL